MFKRNYFLLTLAVGLLLVTLAFSRSGVEIEFSPVKLVDRSMKLPLELSVTNFSGIPVREVRVFYRFTGEGRFRTQRLQNQGFSYFASVNLAGAGSGMVEYYFQIRYMDQGMDAYPAGAPEGRVFRAAVRQFRDYGDQIVIVSPDPGEQIFTSELVITASFARFADKVDVEKTKLYLDTWDLSRYLLKYEDFVSFAPRKVPTGRHKIRLELYGSDGSLVASREWFFTSVQSRVYGGEEGMLQLKGRVYAEARQENLQDGAFSRDYNQGAVQLRGNYSHLSFGGRAYLSNQEASDRQPVNRFSGFARLDFWNHRYIEARYGDNYPKFNPLILQNIFVRGLQSRLFLKFMNLDVAYGQSMRGIEGEGYQDNSGGNPTTVITRGGTYARDILAVRPSIGAGEKFQWGITFLKAHDDTTSIQYGYEPKESASLGTDLLLGLDNQRILFEGYLSASSYNRNITGGSIPFDTLQKIDPDDFDESLRDLYDFQKKIITVNQYLLIVPSLAYQARVRFRYFKNNLSLMYESTDEDYYSLGQPYLLRDNRGFHLSDNVNLFRNQVFLTLGYKKYHNNLNDTKVSTTQIQNVYVNLAYYPLNNLPEIMVGFNNYQRKNDISADSLGSLLHRPEDNQTISLNFSSGYRFQLLNFRHRIGVNVMNFRRTDIFKFAESTSDFLNLNLKTDFSIPLRTTLEFILQNNEIGQSSDRGSTLKVVTYGAGAQYTFSHLLANDKLMVRGLARFGKLESTYQASQSSIMYNRSYFSLRLNYSLPRLGSIGLMADYMIYSGDRTYKDHIVSARYDLNF